MAFIHTRRHFLKSAGACAALTPLVNLLQTNRAKAAAPKRAMFVYVPDGCIPDSWHPTGSETNFTLSPMTQPLESVKQHLIFLDGLTMYSGGATHEGGMAKVLTGVSPQSIDIYLGDQIGASSPFRSLQLGVGATFQDGAGSMSYIGEGQPVAPDDDPTNVFARVFGGVSGNSSDGSLDVSQLRKKSILDTALSDIQALQSQLGTSERQKLENHLQSVREVEQRLSGASAVACDISGYDDRGFQVIETDYYPLTYHKEENFRVVGEMMMDQAALALSCGVTNVVSLQWSHAVSPTHLVDTGVTTANHDASHYGDANSQNAADFITLKQWFMDRFAYLINRLASTPDEGGTLLDNTVVMLCSELGDSNLHDHARVPFLLAGSAGGAFQTGRLLDFRGTNGGENEPHTKLLVSIAQALDVNIDSFGYSGHGTGPLPGL